MSAVDVISNQALSLREREIKFMIENSLRLPTGQNFSVKSAASTGVDGLQADQARQVPWLTELKTFCCEASVVDGA